MVGWNIVAGNVKEIGNLVMYGHKTLEMSARLEALHDPFSPPGRLMGILRPVIQAFVGSMFNAWHDVALCRAIRSQLVRDHHSR